MRGMRLCVSTAKLETVFTERYGHVDLRKCDTGVYAMPAYFCSLPGLKILSALQVLDLTFDTALDGYHGVNALEEALQALDGTLRLFKFTFASLPDNGF